MTEPTKTPGPHHSAKGPLGRLWLDPCFQPAPARGREEGATRSVPKPNLACQKTVGPGEPGARGQELRLLAQIWGESHFQSLLWWLSRCPGATRGAWPSPGEFCSHTAPPVTHHPLHLLGHLVATQVVVEGTLGPPVRRVVPNGVGSLAIHLGDHGLLFFLGEQHRCISLWAHPPDEPVWRFSFLPGDWPGAQGLRQLPISSLHSLEPRVLPRFLSKKHSNPSRRQC